MVAAGRSVLRNDFTKAFGGQGSRIILLGQKLIYSYVEFCSPSGRDDNTVWNFSAAKAQCCQLKQEVRESIDFQQINRK